MIRKFPLPVLAGLALVLCGTSLRAGNWAQFRGPNASGRPELDAPLPDAIGPTTNVVWKVALPKGHSSPAIFGKRIYVTAERDNKLFTIALDRQTGEKVWEAEAPHEMLEEIHAAASHATPSPATDGSIVVSFFGSCGLFAYNKDGKFLWHKPMGPFKNDFGSGTSPILVDDRVILCQDHDTDSFLMAVDKLSGKTLWTTDRSEFPRNYCTPVIWEVAGKKQIVVAATLRIVGYDFETGKELWTVRGVARIVNMTPVIDENNILYAACWSPGAESNDRITTVPYADLIAECDANKNGTIEAGEAPVGPVKERFTQIDRDKNGHITKDEYDSMRRVFESAQNVVVAIKPGGTGDITDTHVLWKYTKQIPYCPSPVYYRGQLFMIRKGGILAIVDTKTGESLKQGRIAATGDYFSSPVAGDGKVFMIDQRGKLTVLEASPAGREISTADFGEDAYACPAIADGKIYVRTSGHLYCFGLPSGSGK